MKRTISSIAFLLASTLAIMPVAQGENVSIVGESTFSVKFTGKESFQKLIKLGKYYSVDEELTEINPKPEKIQKGLKKLSVLKFSETVPMEDVVAQLKARGFRPATVIELLAFGAQEIYAQDFDGSPILSPDAALEFVDTYDEERMIQKNYIYLRRIGDKRILSVNTIGSFWNKNWRCLAVKLVDEEYKTGTPPNKSANQERR